MEVAVEQCSHHRLDRGHTPPRSHGTARTATGPYPAHGVVSVMPRRLRVSAAVAPGVGVALSMAASTFGHVVDL